MQHERYLSEVCEAFNLPDVSKVSWLLHGPKVKVRSVICIMRKQEEVSLKSYLLRKDFRTTQVLYI